MDYLKGDLNSVEQVRNDSSEVLPLNKVKVHKKFKDVDVELHV